MFTFDEAYTFDWPVVVQLPVDGDYQAFEFTGTFRMVEEDALFARSGELEPSGDIAAVIAGERDKMAERLVGWKGISTPDGSELRFSTERRDQLLKQRPVREAVTKAYFDAVIRGALAEKN